MVIDKITHLIKEIFIIKNIAKKYKNMANFSIFCTFFKNIIFFNKLHIILSGRKVMIIANIIALIIVAIGCINWGLVGIFGWNLVTAIFGATIGATIVYVLVLLSIIWLLISLFMERGRISFRRD